ncbi:MAG TPA: glutamate-cysteine ligase family protein [Oligoflexus sp.]|uniref:carboxylate-amine ligase n=1 Tax=Oligoflexus sp. TaxID=1971216 RepID=UPI002D7E5E0A|nr:glutamate-cysteine ligase family protein [Oligoflexus sp.]HET9238354.1 glutamate-cysteine ligase family protein [Oligoflexus sp.]
MSQTLRLFEGYGIEMEYMIVDRQTLAVKPICDQVIEALSGEITNEISLGRINLSNELVLHVIEFKGNGPQKDLVRLASSFQSEIQRVNALLEKWNACLLPTAMHPTMDPLKDTKIWPHGQNTIYETYNRIFDCKGHGWSNLQSVHINLPFADDAEFAKLHAAIRIALPLLPGLAASSPVVEGKITGIHDNRLNFYSQNQKRIPSIIGDIIPEAVFTQKDYEEKILRRIERDIQPFDSEGILEGEWLNSRGAIARFERNAIEIRVLDIQECVAADFAVIGLVVSLVKSLVDERWMPLSEQKAAHEKELQKTFMGALRDGGAFEVNDPFLLRCFGQKKPLSLQSLWRHIFAQLVNEDYQVKHFAEQADTLLQKGTLSHRILKKLPALPAPQDIHRTWQTLAASLNEGTFYG